MKRSRVLGSLVLIATLSARAAMAQYCGGSVIYTPTGNDGLAASGCSHASFWTCQKPVWSGVAYTVAPGCDPTQTMCGVTATATVQWPGLHNNSYPCGLCYAAEVRLLNASGGAIDSCGTLGGRISQDFGIVSYSASLKCSDAPASGHFTFSARNCETASGCFQSTDLPIDFLGAPEVCPPPLQTHGPAEPCLPGLCGSGALGATAPDGPPPGFLIPGTKSRFFYQGAGVGRPGTPGSVARRAVLGLYWSHDFAEQIVQATTTHVYLLTRWGTFREFFDDNADGTFERVRPSDELRKLTKTAGGWELRDGDGSVTAYRADGQWLRTTDRFGKQTQGTYNASNQLASVSLPDGRSELFTYYASGKLQSFTQIGVDGTSTKPSWVFTWSGDQLASVLFPDGMQWVFTYGDARFPGYLTRIDHVPSGGGAARVVGAWSYTATGRLFQTWRGSVGFATGVDKQQLTYTGDPPTQVQRTDWISTADNLTQSITYSFGYEPNGTKPKLLQIVGGCPSCGSSATTTLEYNAAGKTMLPSALIDGRGHRTELTYDANGQVTDRTEAAGTTLARTTHVQYHPTFFGLRTLEQRPSVTGSGNRQTSWSYDGSTGVLLQQTVSGAEESFDADHDGLPEGAFTLSTAYSGHNGAGQPGQIDPPGFDQPGDPGDATAFTYDEALRGGLLPLGRTEPLGLATSYRYDPFNRRIAVTDANNVTTETRYDALDRAVRTIQRAGTLGVDFQLGDPPAAGDLVTDYAYDGFGMLARTTLPRGNVVEYGYDGAGRLISVERKADANPATHGERAFYQLDDAGLRTRESQQVWQNNAWSTRIFTDYLYTSTCHVDKVIQADGSATESTYDCDGNLDKVWDADHPRASFPSQPTQTYVYDALERMTELHQPWAGAGGGESVTRYGYDSQDHLSSVTDANNAVTTYVWSDRDLQVREVSPVSGTTTHAFNEHGALVRTTDARNVVTMRQTDPLDRVTQISYPDSSLTTTFSYDQGSPCFGKGRLSSITRAGQPVSYCYDRFGRTLADGSLAYAYDANGNVSTIGYPGGNSSIYTYDFADRPSSLSATVNGVTQPVASSAEYAPGGPLTKLTLGNGLAETRTFDQQYHPATIQAQGPVSWTWSYTTDHLGNIEQIVRTLDCANGNLVLQNQSYADTRSFQACNSITAGPAMTVASPGNVTLSAGSSVLLREGFTVAPGSTFLVQVDPQLASGYPQTVTKAYGYQDFAYFLTTASGPWGTRAWTYDKTGNRLTERRDGGPAQDAYSYEGVTSRLDLIHLAQGSTRDYSFDNSGNLTAVNADGNLISFTNDDASELHQVSRLSQSVSFSYDGRGYLRQAGDLTPTTGRAFSLYDSAGRLHELTEQMSTNTPEQQRLVLYFAGRPVAIAATVSGSTSWLFLTTDHLGTPALATNAVGEKIWEGGFEPFGSDWLAGTFSGASESGVFLRLPGQWVSDVWASTTEGAEVHYNVNRWYEPSTSRYGSADPIRILRAIGAYGYARQRPTILIDPLGLQSSLGTSSYPSGCCPRNRDCCQTALSQGNFPPGAGGISVCCDGKKVPCALFRGGLPRSQELAQRIFIKCILAHESRHIKDLPDCPQQCGVFPAEFPTAAQRSGSECSAANAELDCLVASAPTCANDSACLTAVQARVNDLVTNFKPGFGCLW
jgi:RHS repeat-associated protein